MMHSSIFAMLAGLSGGLVASWVMDRFQAVVAPLLGYDSADGDPATVQLADAASEAARGRPVPKPHRMLAGAVVHYATGAGLGLVYGVLVWVWPVAAIGFGAVYGIAVALVLDDLVVPAFGLGDWPWRSDVRTQLYGIASHVVFGLVLEGVRRALTALLA